MRDFPVTLISGVGLMEPDTPLLSFDVPGVNVALHRKIALPFPPFPGLLLSEHKDRAPHQVVAVAWIGGAREFRCSMAAWVLPRAEDMHAVLRDAFAQGWRVLFHTDGYATAAAAAADMRKAGEQEPGDGSVVHVVGVRGRFYVVGELVLWSLRESGENPVVADTLVDY